MMKMMNQKKPKEKILLINYHLPNSILMLGKDNSLTPKTLLQNSNHFGKNSTIKDGQSGKLFITKMKVKVPIY